MRYLMILALLTTGGATVAALAADAPTSQPAVTTFFPVDRALTYRVPAGWQTAGGTGTSARYTVPGGDASVSLSILPPDTKLTPEFQEQVLQSMKDARLKAKTTIVVSAPAVETDERFPLRIHERYTFTDARKTTHTSDDVLICRPVGTKILMLSVKTAGANLDQNNAILKSAEDMLLSVGADAGSPFAGPLPTAALGNGLVTYTPPSGWQPGKTTPNVVSYITPAHDGILAIELLPVDMTMTHDAPNAIVKQLQATRAKSGSKVILAATIEPDDRFALKIHERYEVGRKDTSTKIADQIHFYRAIGSRFVMLTVNTVADDPETVKSTQKAAEDTLLSATVHRPGEKKPIAPK